MYSEIPVYLGAGKIGFFSHHFLKNDAIFLTFKVKKKTGTASVTTGTFIKENW